MSWDQQVPLYNHGIPGIGNVGIIHKMLECDLKYSFTDEDLILVVWSSWNREDRYKDGRWLAGGNILNSMYYDKSFIEKYWSIENNIVKNSTAIINANRCFNINFQGHIAPIMSGKYDLLTDNEQKLFDLYKPSLPLDNIFSTTIKSFNTTFAKVMRDNHPDVLEHLEYLNNNVYKTLGLTMSPNTVKVCDDIQRRMIQEINPKLDDGEKTILVKNIVNEVREI